MLLQGRHSDRPPRPRVLVVATELGMVQHASIALRPFYQVILVPDVRSCIERLCDGPAFDAILVDTDSLAKCHAAYRAIADTFPALATRSVFVCKGRDDVERLRERGVAAVAAGSALAELLRALREVLAPI